MNRFSLFFIVPWILFFLSCGSDKLDVKGDPEAVKMGESMIKAMGGRKAWTKIKSVYIRTVNSVANSNQSFVFEEWIELDEPIFINRKYLNGEPVIQIINKNDGWSIRNNEVSMLPPVNITNYLKWHDQYLLVNLKRLAAGGDQVVLELNGEKRFDMLINGNLKCSFELDNNNLIKKYYAKNITERINTLVIDEYSEYEGYKFPLELSVENSVAWYKTDYFDPSPLPVEKAFNVSLNPNDMVK